VQKDGKSEQCKREDHGIGTAQVQQATGDLLEARTGPITDQHGIISPWTNRSIWQHSPFGHVLLGPI
jgi:hypothetical protein